MREEEFRTHFQSEWSRQRGDYLAILDRWERAFPRERLLLGFYEEVKDCPEDLLRRVFRHLGVSEGVDLETFPLREVVNEGPRISMPASCREFLEQLYADEMERLSRRFGDRVSTWRSGRTAR